jgi:hypothetical protein
MNQCESSNESTITHPGIRCAGCFEHENSVKCEAEPHWTVLYRFLIVLVDQCIAWRKICWNDGGFGPSPLVSCGLSLIHFRSINLGSGGQYPNHLDGYGYSEAAGFKHRLTLRAVMNQLSASMCDLLSSASFNVSWLESILAGHRLKLKCSVLRTRLLS